ncbi:MAG TPA: hypothetical protein VGH38_32180 [Bryobacteraceae bacterium]|jgi:hypothetical protein
MSSAGAALLAAAAAVLAHSQSVDIYPELRRPDPFGGVVAADRAVEPREILSPAVARNGFASFHVVVSVPPNETYLLYVVTNPLNACRVALYKEHFAKTNQGWIPDALTEVTRLPDFGAMPDPDDHIEGQSTRSYLLDLWIPPNADVARFRLEVQLKVGDFTVRPMEVRVLEARIPDLAAAAKPPFLPSIDQGADASALDAVREYLSGLPPRAEAHPATVRAVILRNAEQDMALAGSLDREIAGKEAVGRRAMEMLHENYTFPPRLLGPEWYLRLRDFLYAQRIPAGPGAKR